ncbi:glycosyl transferase, group 1 [Chitinispirillum alkaliphilum]|nr:glycosyl transferase, group 1 [Chitinispirillum alkaliphilum]
MKIVYLSASTLPSRTANSIHVMKMCQAFVSAGHEVMLYARKGNGKNSHDSLFCYYGVKKTFKIKLLRHFRLPYYGHIYGLFIACHAFFAKPDLVIARHPAGCFFSTLFGLPTVFEIHGPISESGKMTRFYFELIRKLPSFKKLVLITHTLKQHYLAKYKDLNQKEIVVLPDAADNVDLSEITPKGIRLKDKLNIGYTGHLYKGKGMEVIAPLVTECLEYHFHIVGGRDKDISFWSERLKSNSNVSFHGAVAHSDIVEYLVDFDIVLLPNQMEVSGNAGKDIGNWTSPLKLFEYMAARKCIIASDIPVLREVLNENNALLCNPNNIDDWVSAIKVVAGDRNIRNNIAKNAFNDFINNYTWAKRANNIIESIG